MGGKYQAQHLRPEYGSTWYRWDSYTNGSQNTTGKINNDIKEKNTDRLGDHILLSILYRENEMQSIMTPKLKELKQAKSPSSIRHLLFFVEDEQYDGTLTEAAREYGVPILEEFLCPIKLEIMTKPLLSRYGHNFEHDAIVKWLDSLGGTIVP
jgi:U-box domain